MQSTLIEGDKEVASFAKRLAADFFAKDHPDAKHMGRIITRHIENGEYFPEVISASKVWKANPKIPPLAALFNHGDRARMQALDAELKEMNFHALARAAAEVNAEGKGDTVVGKVFTSAYRARSRGINAATTPAPMATQKPQAESDDIEGDWNANRDGCRDSFKRFHAYKAYRLSNTATLPASGADDHDDHDTGGTITMTKPTTTAPAKAAKNPQATAAHLWSGMSDRERRRFANVNDLAARIGGEVRPGQLTNIHESRYPT